MHSSVEGCSPAGNAHINSGPDGKGRGNALERCHHRAAGQTASPAPVVSALPAAVPQTGGPADTGGTPWALVLAVFAAPLVIGSAALAVRLRKRQSRYAPGSVRWPRLALAGLLVEELAYFPDGLHAPVGPDRPGLKLVRELA